MAAGDFVVPSLLYRYRSVASEYWLEDLIRATKSEFFHASPSSWNDPFDFRPVWRDATLGSVSRLLKKGDPKKGLISREALARFQGRSLSRNEYRSALKGKRDPLSLAKAHKRAAKTIIESFSNKIVASCFSATSNSAAMWAHYSGNHAGICLEFAVDIPLILYPNEPIPLPVAYSKNRPVVSFEDLGIFSGRLRRVQDYARRQNSMLDALFWQKVWNGVMKGSGEHSSITKCLLGTTM